MRYILILILFLSGCGFSGSARKTEHGWEWKTNRPSKIIVTEDRLEADGKGDPLIKLPDIVFGKIK